MVGRRGGRRLPESCHRRMQEPGIARVLVFTQVTSALCYESLRVVTLLVQGRRETFANMRGDSVRELGP